MLVAARLSRTVSLLMVREAQPINRRCHGEGMGERNHVGSALNGGQTSSRHLPQGG